MITLSLDAINQVSPYKVVMTDGDYDFVTSEGVRYSASFLEDVPMGGCDTYQFGFRRKDDQHTQFTMCTASEIVENQGFYAAIIVENCNPKLEAIINDFNHSAESLTTGKP